MYESFFTTLCGSTYLYTLPFKHLSWCVPNDAKNFGPTELVNVVI